MIWLLLAIGLVLGPAINFAIYYFAYFSRPISPWQSKPKQWEVDGKKLSPIVPSHLAKIPILGWLTRWSERSEFGRWFWVRPLVIEMATPFLLIALFLFIRAEGLVPQGGPAVSVATLDRSFACLAVLFSLLVVATFIDFDERMIPDWITVPGTLFALIGSACAPDWRLRDLLFTTPPTTAEVHPNSPWSVFSPNWLQGTTSGLGLTLFCWFGWCIGLLDRAWITRRGWKKAWIYFWAIIARSPSTLWITPMAILGAIAIVVANHYLSSSQWEGLVSSLLGIALGGALVWSFRIVATIVMQREALGFGDVTLMAMVGAFVGWQAVWAGFFIAPFFGLIFVVAMWIMTGDNSTPFGPYLSMGVAFTILSWATMWPAMGPLFFPPITMLLLLAGLLILLAFTLGFVQWVKLLFKNDRRSRDRKR